MAITSISAYVERLISDGRAAEDELESLAIEGIESGAPIVIDPGYWTEKGRRLDARLIVLENIERGTLHGSSLSCRRL